MTIQELLYTAGRYDGYEGGPFGAPIVPEVPEANRDGLDGLWGTYEPTYELTGLWSGYTYNVLTGATNLPNYHNGNWVITEAVAASLPNRTLSGYKVDGKITVQCNNLTIVNCWVRGVASPTRADLFLIENQNRLNQTTYTGLVVKDCVLIPQHPTFDWNMIGTHDYTAIRVYGKWTVDFFRINRGSGVAGTPYDGPVNVKILACFAEESSYFYNDPNHTNDNRTHADWVQIEGGSGIQIIGNKMVGKHAGWQSNYIPSLAIPGAQTAPSPLWPGAVYLNTSGTDEGSAAWNIFAPGELQPPSVPGGYGRFGWSLMTGLVQIIPNTGQISNLLLDRNWMYACATMVSAANNGTFNVPAGGTNLGVLTNNKFHRTAGQPDQCFTFGTRYTTSTSGNTYMDNGAPAKIGSRTN